MEQQAEATCQTTGKSERLPTMATDSALHASHYARSVPGSVEAALVILVAAAALMAAGMTGGWPLVVCAAGLMWGKVWWRGVTLVLALLFAAMIVDAAAQLPSRASSLVTLGTILSYGGLAGLACGQHPSPRQLRAAVMCAAVGIAAVLAGAARLRLGL